MSKRIFEENLTNKLIWKERERSRWNLRDEIKLTNYLFFYGKSQN